MGQSNSLDLENVVRHLHGRDTSLRWMFSPHGIPLKASTNRCGENIAIAITHSVLGRERKDSATLKNMFVGAVEPKPPAHL